VAGFSEKSLADLDIEPVQCKKIVVYNYQIYTDVTVGVFALSGNTNVLQYFYLAGLGSKHSAGFGMCDVLSQG
jgi:CRISPR-associated endoribonuclease Cas6